MKIHFIGIGGIGVSALAQYYLAGGEQVTGSDLIASEITGMLKKRGAEIFIGPHKGCLMWKIKQPELVIYSPAVPVSNSELKKAQRLGIKCLSYPQALGELTKKYFTIAVCGTHGKSTTAAMISLILIKAGLDPTVIIGTKLKEFGNSNFRMGKTPNYQLPTTNYLVIEADEWQASFLNYWPKVIVLTNIEREHLDYYKDLNHILRTYGKFISHLPEDGVLIANRDDPGVYQIIFKFLSKSFNLPTPLNSPPSPAGRGERGVGKLCSKFQVFGYSIRQKEANHLRKILKIPGEHNVSNALAAFSAIRYGIRYATLEVTKARNKHKTSKPLRRHGKISNKTVYQALSEYNGSWRRFEIKRLQITNYKLQVVDDYGHHPTEIKATLEAAREKWPKKELWLIFQPHQYQRTHYLFNDFVKVFREVLIDRIIITDIYDVAGRENKAIKAKVSSKKLVKAIKKSYIIYLKKAQILAYLRENINQKQQPIIIVMGAGDIYQLFNS